MSPTWSRCRTRRGRTCCPCGRSVADGGILVDGVGRHTQANAAAHPDVTLVFPPRERGGYTLLVDGTATVDGSTVTIAPVTAILHRPAAGPDGRRAGSDCVDVSVAASRRA